MFRMWPIQLALAQHTELSMVSTLSNYDGQIMCASVCRVFVCHPFWRLSCCTDAGPDPLLASMGPDSVTLTPYPTYPYPFN